MELLDPDSVSTDDWNVLKLDPLSELDCSIDKDEVPTAPTDVVLKSPKPAYLPLS